VKPQETIVRVAVRPYGSALPLGFFSFGVGMLVLGGIGLGWVHGADLHVAGILLAAFVFPLEFLSATIAFLARDTASAASLGMFSTSWLALGMVHLFAPPGQRSAAVGLYLIMFGVMILALAAASMSGKPLLGILLGIASMRAFLGASWNLGAGHALLKADGATAIPSRSKARLRRRRSSPVTSHCFIGRTVPRIFSSTPESWNALTRSVFGASRIFSRHSGSRASSAPTASITSRTRSRSSL
jgi:succinate-acetate transporter protein